MDRSILNKHLEECTQARSLLKSFASIGDQVIGIVSQNDESDATKVMFGKSIICAMVDVVNEVCMKIREPLYRQDIQKTQIDNKLEVGHNTGDIQNYVGETVNVTHQNTVNVVNL